MSQWRSLSIPGVLVSVCHWSSETAERSSVELRNYEWSRHLVSLSVAVEFQSDALPAALQTATGQHQERRPC